MSGISAIAGSVAPQAMSRASAVASPSAKMASVFSSFTTPGTGTITKNQFVQTFNTMKPTAGFHSLGANGTFSVLDPNSTGAVSRQDFISGMTRMMADFKAQRIS